ncbi:MAG: hypothetical protein EXR71_01690 [Myxococcales bacterium]|nr:hypothetical protein [Myxococcales bacterium]
MNARAGPRLFSLGAAIAVVAAVAVAAVDAAHPMFNDMPWVAMGFAIPAAAGVSLRLGARWAAVAYIGATAAWLGSAGDRLGALPTRMLVFGVDGATWQVIDREPLPNFHRLLAEGTRANLISMEPMFSPLLWTTIASGRPVGDHGVRGFRVQSTDCRVARWWDIAEHNGDAVGLYKWLVDYPPRRFAHGGFWVPGWLAPAPETWPARLAVVKEVELGNRQRRKTVGARGASWERVRRLVNVGVRLSTFVDAARWTLRDRLGNPDEAARNVSLQLLRGDIDRDVFIEQLYVERPSVASLNYYAIDGLSHLYWERYEAGGTELSAAYRQADALLGELAERAGPSGRILVVSDHGFAAMDSAGTAGQFLPQTERLRARISAAVAPVDVTRLGHKLVVGVGSPEGAATVRTWLTSLVDRGGLPFYEVAAFPDDDGSLALTLTDESFSAERLASETVGGEPIAQYVTMTAAYTGMHERHGIFLALGGDVPRGIDAGDIPLLDAAPTILAGAGLPAAMDMPGRAQVWPESPRVASWDWLLPTLSFASGASGIDEAMLKELGYIDDGSKP